DLAVLFYYHAQLPHPPLLFPYTTLFRAWKKGTLYFCSKVRMTPIGAAEPPQSTPRRLEISYAFSSNSFNSPNQIVGTPAVIVTLYLSINVANRFGVKRGPGITCVDPNHVHAKGMPHAFT